MAISPPKAKTAHAAAAPVGTVACTAPPSVAPAAEPPHAKGKGKGEKPTPMASEQWAPADDLVGMGLFMPRAPQDLSPVADVRRSASALSSTSSTSEGTEKASGSKRRTREKPLRPDGKPTINLIFMGHVDAGKSTLNGHLLHLLKD
jgi:peptide chain release factor subunit 3